ncbi:unnamed protein product [Meganyctiphanes norvegica]|uniref:Secreted protein n=1 Tax=Meganyctiphanes norvegica TaxID=48144 RepID=A0AAV2SRJ8_MEGNR
MGRDLLLSWPRVAAAPCGGYCCRRRRRRLRQCRVHWHRPTWFCYSIHLRTVTACLPNGFQRTYTATGLHQGIHGATMPRPRPLLPRSRNGRVLSFSAKALRAQRGVQGTQSDQQLTDLFIKIKYCITV